MRLLNTTTFKLKEFVSDFPPYAILSHTWGDEEVSYQEIDLPERENKRGFAKIRGCCHLALGDGLDWAWIDTCCIDKTSSAELSEAINSMFMWYRDAYVCYVYLEDVPNPDPGFPEKEFYAARWFSRGWCLQELIAPQFVEFYTTGWQEIGTKLSLCDSIHEITGIPLAVLLGEEHALDWCNMAQKLSWASTRETTRVEDEAYCLLGIFGINMPLLYGEGARAFQRLQEELIQQTEDYSFLLWTGVSRATAPAFSVFASRPADFDRIGPLNGTGERLPYRLLRRCSPGRLPRMLFATDHESPEAQLTWNWNPSQMTSRGLHVSLPSLATAGLETQANGSELLMWSGFVYRAHFVCVPLILSFGRYFRTKDSIQGLQLLEWRPSIGFGFKVRDIYLGLGQRNMEGGKRNARPPTTLGTIVRIVLLSSSDTSLTIDDERDESNLDLHLETSEAEHLNGTANRTEVWAANVDTTSDDEDEDWECELWVRIFASSPGPVWAQNYTVRQMVKARLHFQGRQDGGLEYPTCTLSADDWLRSSPTEFASWLGPAKGSDRADVVLNTGQHLIASIKRTPTSYEGWDGNVPRSDFILRVAVVP